MMQTPWWQILLSTGAAYIIGAAWYGWLFRKPWMKLKGMKEGPTPEGIWKSYAFNFIATLMTAILLATLIGLLGLSPAKGAVLGFVVWLGFVATTQANQVLWGDAPVKLYLIETSHLAVVFTLLGLLLAL